LKSGKSRQHVACRLLKTACCSPERSILQLLRTVQYHHAITSWFSMLTALMASTWVAVEVTRAVKSSVPVTCPWGSTRSCHMAPVHFWPPIGGLVSSLHVNAPLLVPHGPPAKGPACSDVELPSPNEPPWGSHAPVGFELPHVHMLGPMLLL
jgi:hypothetical protein